MTRIAISFAAAACIGFAGSVLGSPGRVGEDVELAFGLSEQQFAELTVCHLDALTKTYQTLARRDRTVVSDPASTRMVQASMVVEATEGAVSCIEKQRLPIRPERARACYPVAAFLPADAPALRERGGSEDALSDAWASFSNDELEKKLLAAWSRRYFQSHDERASVKGAIKLAQCARFPGASLELNAELIKKAAGEWAQ